jgi:phage shock protein PspC (stress-responsive transcriptional regulator)
MDKPRKFHIKCYDSNGNVIKKTVSGEELTKVLEIKPTKVRILRIIFWVIAMILSFISAALFVIVLCSKYNNDENLPRQWPDNNGQSNHAGPAAPVAHG